MSGLAWIMAGIAGAIAVILAMSVQIALRTDRWGHTAVIAWMLLLVLAMLGGVLP